MHPGLRGLQPRHAQPRHRDLMPRSRRARSHHAVYVSGNPPALEALEALARKHNLRLILDAAHAWLDLPGRPAGTFGDAEVFSLSPTKTITTCEGGLVSLRDADIAHRSASPQLRQSRRLRLPFVGLNARIARSTPWSASSLSRARRQRRGAPAAREGLPAAALESARGAFPRSQLGNTSSQKDVSCASSPAIRRTRDDVRTALSRAASKLAPTSIRRFTCRRRTRPGAIPTRASCRSPSRWPARSSMCRCSSAYGPMTCSTWRRSSRPAPARRSASPEVRDAPPRDSRAALATERRASRRSGRSMSAAASAVGKQHRVRL